VMSSATGLWKLFRDQAERDSGIGLKLFGFIAESVFTIIPESCSGSPRNSVRNHPGIAFTFDRIPHQSGWKIQTSRRCSRTASQLDVWLSPSTSSTNSPGSISAPRSIRSTRASIASSVFSCKIEDGDNVPLRDGLGLTWHRRALLR